MQEQSPELKKVECDCGFEVKDHAEKELIDIVKMHVKNTHQQDVSDSEVKDMIQLAN
jgi:predicted small metal-binding protein